MIGFKNAEFILYPLSRHAFLTGLYDKNLKPIHNFNYFASMNTMMLNADGQVFSHVPDFQLAGREPEASDRLDVVLEEKY